MFKGDSESHLKIGNLTPVTQKKPEPIDTTSPKLSLVITSGKSIPVQDFTRTQLRISRSCPRKWLIYFTYFSKSDNSRLPRHVH